ncbi:MAG: hypothetical protein JJ863_03060 [Deltaproteobacteria bacterium]|nr:hypothetical protein [Deltaproteobacteria bacterium]
MALIDSLGPAAGVESAEVVPVPTWGRTHYCFRQEGEPGLTQLSSLFGAPCATQSNERGLDQNEFRGHVTDALRVLNDAEPGMRSRVLAAHGSMSVDVASLAYVVHRRGSAALARALLEQAVETPHVSMPAPDSSPMRQLEGDLALAALRDALARYEGDPTMTTVMLRSRLEVIAGLDGLEAAAAADPLVEVLRRMERALAAPQPSAEARAANEPSQLYRWASEPKPSDAMAALLPLVESDFPVRQVDRSTYESSDLVRVGHVALSMASQVIGRPLTDPDELRAWWAANEADEGAGEAWTMLERSRDEAIPSLPIGVYVARLVALAGDSSDATLRRLDALHRRGTSSFRQQLLMAVPRDRWAEHATWQSLVRRSIASTQLDEVATAARVMGSDERTFELAERRLSEIAAQDGDDYRVDSAVSSLAQMLVQAGRPAAVLGVWTELPHRIREQLAAVLPGDLEPALAAAALADESTLAFGGAPPDCPSLLAADVIAARMAVSSGGAFDCVAAPSDRRAARAAMAGAEASAEPSIQTWTLANATIDYEGPPALAPVLAEAFGQGSLDAERIRAALTALVRARREPTIVGMLLRALPSGVRLELRVRGGGRPSGFQASAVLSDAAGQSDYIDDVAGPISGPTSPTLEGAAPFRPLLDELGEVLEGNGRRLLVRVRW